MDPRKVAPPGFVEGYQPSSDNLKSPPPGDEAGFSDVKVPVSSLDILYMWANTKRNIYRGHTNSSSQSIRTTCYVDMLNAIDAIRKGELPS